MARSTVSYVLNDTPNQTIPAATREKVLAAAAKLGYAPSAAARTLRSGRSDVVLCLLPDWPVGHAVATLIQRLTAAFAQHKLTFLVHSNTRAARPLSEVWRSVTPAAVLALDKLSGADATAMRAAGVEVIVALHASTRNQWREIRTPENPIGAVQARHLTATHHRLGYAYPDDDRVAVFAEPRLDGVREVCAELGLPEPDVRTVALNPAAAADAVAAWLACDPPVTGICAFNDEIATAVLAGLARHGLRAPQDMAVVGVDDLPGSAVAQPPLTTVVQDFTTIAAHYAQSVAAALRGERIPAEPLEAEYRLVIREST